MWTPRGTSHPRQRVCGVLGLADFPPGWWCLYVWLISFGRVLMMNTRAQRELQHTWIIQVVVKHQLVQIGRIDGRTDYLSKTLTGIRFIIRGAAPEKEPPECATRGQVDSNVLSRHLQFNSCLLQMHVSYGMYIYYRYMYRMVRMFLTDTCVVWYVCLRQIHVSYGT